MFLTKGWIQAPIILYQFCSIQNVTQLASKLRKRNYLPGRGISKDKFVLFISHPMEQREWMVSISRAYASRNKNSHTRGKIPGQYFCLEAYVMSLVLFGSSYNYKHYDFDACIKLTLQLDIFHVLLLLLRFQLDKIFSMWLVCLFTCTYVLLIQINYVNQ